MGFMMGASLGGPHLFPGTHIPTLYVGADKHQLLPDIQPVSTPVTSLAYAVTRDLAPVTPILFPRELGGLFCAMTGAGPTFADVLMVVRPPQLLYTAEVRRGAVVRKNALATKSDVESAKLAYGRWRDEAAGFAAAVSKPASGSTAATTTAPTGEPNTSAAGATSAPTDNATTSADGEHVVPAYLPVGILFAERANAMKPVEFYAFSMAHIGGYYKKKTNSSDDKVPVLLAQPSLDSTDATPHVPPGGVEESTAGDTSSDFKWGFVVYGKTACPFTQRALHLLKATARVPFQFIEVSSARDPVVPRAALGVPEDFGTVPVVAHNGSFIGGSDELSSWIANWMKDTK